jgi:hypothetical protein
MKLLAKNKTMFITLGLHSHYLPTRQSTHTCVSTVLNRSPRERVYLALGNSKA